MNVATIALANKNARIARALLAHDRTSRSDYATAGAATQSAVVEREQQLPGLDVLASLEIDASSMRQLQTGRLCFRDSFLRSGKKPAATHYAVNIGNGAKTWFGDDDSARVECVEGYSAAVDP